MGLEPGELKLASVVKSSIIFRHVGDADRNRPLIYRAGLSAALHWFPGPVSSELTLECVQQYDRYEHQPAKCGNECDDL